MPNEHKYHQDKGLGDGNRCTNTVFDSLDDEPIFADDIPILTERLSAIELQMARSSNKRSIETNSITATKKGLLGGFWLRRKDKQLTD